MSNLRPIIDETMENQQIMSYLRPIIEEIMQDYEKIYDGICLKEIINKILRKGFDEQCPEKINNEEKIYKLCGGVDKCYSELK